MKYRIALIIILTSFFTSSLVATERSLFIFDFALKEIKDMEERVLLLKELGYEGVSGPPNKRVLGILDKHGLKMPAFFTYLRKQDGDWQTQGIVNVMNNLKGRDTIIWLTITDKEKTVTDDELVPALQELAKQAEEKGLRIALYPHLGYYTNTVQSCLRIARQITRLHRPDHGHAYPT